MPKSTKPDALKKATSKPKINDFTNFGFKKFVNEALRAHNFKKPTAIQEAVIPLLKKHQNVIALAPTGTGKTHAFLLPLLNNLHQSPNETVQCVIVVPTRELGQQIFEETRLILKNQPDFKSQLFVGGNDYQKEVASLTNKQPTVVIGTPTRLKELYVDQALKLTTAQSLVVDEVDMIFDYGFLEDLDFLLNKMNPRLQVAFFSATISQELSQFLKKYSKNSVFINQTPLRQQNPNVEHFLVETKDQALATTFNQLLATIEPFLALIFVNSKDQVPEIVKILHDFGINEVGELHSNLSPRTRDAMLKRLKNNEFQYLVATDIAARGLDFPGASHVISVNLPRDWHYYIHRSGRTGRNGAHGVSYVLKTFDNQKQIDQLQNKGLNFTLLKFNQGSWQSITAKKNKKNPQNLDSESKQVLNRYANKKVKPGYKRKRKEELDTIKKNRRRQHIKESIQKIKKEKYKQRRSTLFDD
ncbi:ATP-dependent RNA helicase CshB [Entomoplasma freundtii]|uniref:ATP-dependent RNA helicase n=1 Tax=Entomoplasma freundtii TaxID=74700 RepID=A0A2K8NRD3_9MOLU|nr:DEAD/DEAH box helicase [Entomoplasma freundtii]ATZ16379.1 ATP-dependent RNA helicase [Entomoplasma freundtii]TDY56582.1 ATP-dependent RNA helicase CshB [Entomoplasma freundtii]